MSQQYPGSQQPGSPLPPPQWGQQPQQSYEQPSWNPQQPMYPPQQPMMPPPSPPKKKAWYKRPWGIALIALMVIAACSGTSNALTKGATTASTIATTTANTSVSTPVFSGSTPVPTYAPTATPTPVPAAVRQVTGKTTTLGAGTFSGGKDVPVGLYNVTAPNGQSGNFIVSGTDSYNEIFGQGVTKIRAQISDGDQIQLSGLSSVTFTPVSTPFITTHTPVKLYAGTFIVGQDIGAGRYVATTTAGSSGNFIVSGANSVNEILGQNSMGGVPSVTTDLADGDVIDISGLGQVIMTPK